jgi:adiponectin receptor
MSAHSERVLYACLELDYIGVIISISVSCIASTQQGMFGDEPLRTIYDILTLTCACGVLVNLLAPGADGTAAKSRRSVPKYRN